MTLKRFLFTHVVKSPARAIFRVIEFDLQSSHGSNIFGNYPEVVNTESGRFIHTWFYSFYRAAAIFNIFNNNSLKSR